MKIACASDIHGKIKRKFPAADILVLAGDIMANLARGKRDDAMLQRIYARDTLAPWLVGLKRHYKAVVFIPGNHDRAFEFYQREMVELVQKCGVHCLLDSGVEIEGLKFWGSPWTPWFFGDHWSFNLTYAYTKDDADGVWGQIPDDTDVLITHGPPHGILDLVPRNMSVKGKLEGGHVGCPYLLEHVMERVQPKLHVFGHIHEGYGVTMRQIEGDKYTMFVNASVMNGSFKPGNTIRVVNI